MNRVLFLLIIVLNFWQPLVANNITPIKQCGLGNAANITKNHSTDPNYITENTFIDLNEDDELTNTEKKDNCDKFQHQRFFNCSLTYSFLTQRADHLKSSPKLSRPIYLLVGVFQI